MLESRDQRLPGLRRCHQFATSPGYEVETPTVSRLLPFSYPEPFLRAVNRARRRGSGQIHIKLASDWPQRNIWFIVNMNKNTQALHEALVSLWRKLGEKTLLMLKEQQYEAVRKIVVDNRPQKR